MEVKFKSALVAVPLLLMISCSGPEEKMDSKVETVESNPSWDAINSIMYNEFLQCSSGQEYSQDALDEMIKAWRDLELPESMLGAWGYSSLNDDNEIIIDQWEISWTSKESAEKSWEEWANNEKATTWTEKYTSVLQCDSENRLGYDFYFLMIRMHLDRLLKMDLLSLPFLLVNLMKECKKKIFQMKLLNIIIG